MKKILHITSALRRNGTETFIMNAFRNIDRNEISFDFMVYQHVEDGYEEEARSLGAKIYYYTPRFKSWRGRKKSLEKFFRLHAHEYDAVHLNGNSFTEIYPLKVAKKYGVPVRIAHCHNMSTSGLHNKIFHRANRAVIHNRANRFLACSEGAKTYGFKGTPAYEKALVVPNGIDLDRFRFNPSVRERKRKELGLGKELLIGNVAGFREAKNHRFMIEVMKEVVKFHPDSKLILIGNGPLESQIKDFAKESGLSDKVIFMGNRNDVNELMQAMDVFLFPSFYEGFGIVLVEAQAAGLPVIASDSVPPDSGVTPLISFLSLHKSADEWAKAVVSSFNSDRTGSHAGLDKFNIKKTCSMLRKIYMGEESESEKNLAESQSRIIRFGSIFKPTIWGGSAIAALKNINLTSSSIGESWEVSGIKNSESIIIGTDRSGQTVNDLVKGADLELLGSRMADRRDSFPIVIKFIDALQDLSVQVHPDDTTAQRLHGCNGKNEVWFIVDCEEDSKIYAGLKAGVTKEMLSQAVESGILMELVSSWKAEKNQVYYIPAGTVHAIGAGCLIAEIQDCCDITYRLYDYDRIDKDGKKRQLHVEESLQALNPEVEYQGPKTVYENGEMICRNKNFAVEYLEANEDGLELNPGGETFHLLTVVDGDAEITDETGRREPLSRGETVMIPANFGFYRLSGDARVLKTELA